MDKKNDPRIYPMKKLIFILLLLSTQITQAQYTITNYFTDKPASCLAIDGNYIWVNQWGVGVNKYDLEGNIVKTYTMADGLASNHVRSITIDAHGNKWFGADDEGEGGGGVSIFDGTNWITYDKKDGIDNHGAGQIADDAHGNIWFCSSGNGVNKFDGTN